MWFLVGFLFLVIAGLCCLAVFLSRCLTYSDAAKKELQDKLAAQGTAFTVRGGGFMAGNFPEHDMRPPSLSGLHEDVTAAYRYVGTRLDLSDLEGAYAVFGWGVREAFLAGITHARSDAVLASAFCEPKDQLVDLLVPDAFQRTVTTGESFNSFVTGPEDDDLVTIPGLLKCSCGRSWPADSEQGVCLEWFSECFGCRFSAIGTGSGEEMRRVQDEAAKRNFSKTPDEELAHGTS